MTGTYWNGEGKHKERAEELQKLVPPYDKCFTLHGEIWRATTNIYYDYYNNGFGNEWRQPAAFLMGHVDLPEEVVSMLLASAAGNIAGRGEWDKEIEQMVDSVIEQLDTIPNGANETDMWETDLNTYVYNFAPYYNDDSDEDSWW